MTHREALVREKYPNANDQHIAEALVYAGEPNTKDPYLVSIFMDRIFFTRVDDYFSRKVYSNRKVMDSKQTELKMASETWTPTCNLRWVYRATFLNREDEKILQQMWQSSHGNQKWEDIETVTE